MGSRSSKDASSSSSDGSGGGGTKGKGKEFSSSSSSRRRGATGKKSILKISSSYSCFGFTPPPSPPQQQQQQQQQQQFDKEGEGVARPGDSKSDCGKHAPSPSEMASSDQDDAFPNAPATSGGGGGGSRTRATSNQSASGLGINFRLNRAVSLGSCSSVPDSILLSTLPDISPNVGGGRAHPYSDASLALRSTSTVGTESSLDMLRHDVTDQTRAACHAPRNFFESDNVHLRRSNRRIGSQEPSQGSIRFSRTLSVGRLRDRVLRRTPFSDGLFTPTLLYDRSIWPVGNATARQELGGTQGTASSTHRSTDRQSDSSSNNLYQISSSAGGSDHHVYETQELREASNRDLLERRSAFLERRRRIRSQVRALQRLGSRFENLSGHDRSCILSGQHRTGRCTCRTSSRSGNSDEETSTRASISRIVMLAEALFEVLDEIHQQSVALTSRPSLSSIGSVPAPKEVVECLPMKVYRKLPKHQNDEAGQCYICLVEYEEGDCVRILPCSHEFHLTCVDKWLKEIHRVCPLCRGDVCRSDTGNIEKVS